MCGKPMLSQHPNKTRSLHLMSEQCRCQYPFMLYTGVGSFCGTYPAERLSTTLQKEAGIVPDYHPLQVCRHVGSENLNLIKIESSISWVFFQNFHRSLHSNLDLDLDLESTIIMWRQPFLRRTSVKTIH